MSHARGPAGLHVSKGTYKNFYHALYYYKQKYGNLGFPLAAQIFVMGPQSTKLCMKDEAGAVSELCDAGLALFIHSSYLNPLWSDKVFVRQNAIHNVRIELEIGATAHARGLITHLSDIPPEQILPAIRMLHIPPKGPTLFLEMVASGKWPNTYTNPAWINELFLQLGPYNVGLCIDTAHAWATGVDLRTKDNVRGYLQAIKTHGKPILVHLNDNINPVGSRKDQHAPLGLGEIWRTNVGYEAVFESGLPIIFERKDENNVDFATYRRWLETEKK